MQNKGFIMLWVIMVFLISYSPLFGQMKPADRKMLIQRPPERKPFEGWTEEEFLNHLNKVSLAVNDPGNDEYLGSQLYNMAKKAASLGSEEAVQKILAIPEANFSNRAFPEYDFHITHAKIIALRLLKDFPGVREYVIQSLDHQSSRVQIGAASTLLSWGEEWELAAPVICKYEAYLEFQQNKDERAVPLLEDAVKNGSWKGRLYAAAALYYTYGDSTKYPEVALDVILNAPVNTDDEDVNWAKYHALRQVPRFNLESSLPGLCRLAYDDALGISSMAVGYLVHFSNEGFQEATQTLIDIRDNHPDASIREQAKKGLAEQEQE